MSNRILHNRIRWFDGLLALGLFIALIAALGACSSGDESSNPLSESTLNSPVPTATEDPLQGVADLISTVQSENEYESLIPAIFNIDLTSDGPKPAHLYIPSARPVRLIIRNRTRSESHYKVIGLTPENLRWKAVPEEDVERESDISEEDHEAHHDQDFVPWRAESRAGIQPDGTTVHGYSALGELDVVSFTANELGTFEVVDPLHPEFSAMLTVF